MKSVCILGRQPALGLAELESLLGPGPLTPVGDGIVLIDMDAVKVPFSRLGGTVKLAAVLTELPTIDFHKIETYLHKTIPEHLQYVPEGKFTLGLSLYGIIQTPFKINGALLRIKKTIKKAGRSVRIVPNKEMDLNSAQVIHNQLTSMNGWEILLIKNGTSTIIAQTTEIQDIEAYADRDQGRPKRDARVGMLPPKLAQVIVNMAVGGMMPSGNKVLDPFCGTGVLLQEASLMGFDTYGTDLEPRMIDYSATNLAWLKARYSDIHFLYTLEVGDAMKHTWKNPFNAVACEGYLGAPLTNLPNPTKLGEIIRTCDRITKEFLVNLQHQTVPGFRACIAVPAWFDGNGFQHLSTLDRLSDLGYTRVSFVHSKAEDLIYHRPGQIVARELVVLQRK